MIVVYVHGNGNKVRADLLKRQWDQALFGRDAGSGSRMAYWAPLLHPRAASRPGVRRGRAARPDVPGRPRRSRGDGRAPPPRRRGGAGQAYAARDGLHGRGGRRRRAARARPASAPRRCRCPRAARIRIFEQLVKVTFKDVHAYFFRGYAERMRAVVRAAIAGIDEPFVLVSHSLGTIIAYDVLREEASRWLASRCS